MTREGGHKTEIHAIPTVLVAAGFAAAAVSIICVLHTIAKCEARPYVWGNLWMFCTVLNGIFTLCVPMFASADWPTAARSAAGLLAAGIFGALTASRKILYIQALPALLALVAVLTQA